MGAYELFGSVSGRSLSGDAAPETCDFKRLFLDCFDVDQPAICAKSVSYFQSLFLG
jgi:hypothetical protein